MIKIIFTSIILLSLLVIGYYLSGIAGVIQIIISLLIYTTIAYIIHYGWKRFKKGMPLDIKEFIFWFLNRVSVFIVVIGSILGGFAYYNNHISPAPMPTYTLTNGEKEVVFQSMSHIGTLDFYKQIQSNIKEYKEKGGVYFFEGVRPGSKENSEAFDEAIGIKFDKDLYENFSKLYGVVNQDNSMFIGLVNNLDFNIDLSIDEIMELYNQKPNTQTPNTPPIDATKTITETLTGLNERQLNVLVYLNRAILNFIIKSKGTQDLITENFGNKELFDVILNERNKVISNAIINSEYDKIYVTYGLLHFSGVFELLKENDGNRYISKESYLYPIK